MLLIDTKKDTLIGAKYQEIQRNIQIRASGYWEAIVYYMCCEILCPADQEYLPTIIKENIMWDGLEGPWAECELAVPIEVHSSDFPP